MRNRAPNLDDAAIELIVGILDGWSGMLSWEALIDAIELRARARYTRQALHKHQRIRLAFGLRKKAIAEGQGKAASEGLDAPEFQAALQRIARQVAVIARLEAENQNLLEQFARWAYNAQARGLDEAFLNQPLPPVNRDRTVRREFCKSRKQ